VLQEKEGKKRESHQSGRSRELARRLSFHGKERVSVYVLWWKYDSRFWRRSNPSYDCLSLFAGAVAVERPDYYTNYLKEENEYEMIKEYLCISVSVR
jgi:hypothetical protein